MNVGFAATVSNSRSWPTAGVWTADIGAALLSVELANRASALERAGLSGSSAGSHELVRNQSDLGISSGFTPVLALRSLRIAHPRHGESYVVLPAHHRNAIVHRETHGRQPRLRSLCR